MENSRVQQVKQLIPTTLLFGTLLLLPFLNLSGEPSADDSVEITQRANQIAADFAQMRVELSASRSALERAAGSMETP